MAFPKHLDKETLDELLEIIERNRWDRLRKRQLENEISEENFDFEDEEVSPDNVRLVLFGAESSFTKSLIEMFRIITVIGYFRDPENMITFCLDHSVPNILFDVDPPTDCYQVMDIFASVKMLIPSIRTFVCTGRKNSVEVEHLKMYGATILEKPILRNKVRWFKETYCD